MKKNFMKLAGALICIMMSPMFTSCLSEDNPSTSTNSNQADVTIMYYAHGGGNLDPFLIGNIHHMYQAEAESYKNVKVAVEYKFSTTENLSDVPNEAGITPEGSRTFRLVVDHTKTLKEQLPDAYLPGKNADITHPDSLTNFINWAAKQCPAKKYVLILNDHGGGYMPDDELFKNTAASTRGIIYDDGNKGAHFSAPSLVHAIKAANIRPDVIYFDACLMNTLEYVFELKDVTDYVVASTFITLAGPPYATLIEMLSKASDHLKYVLEKYTEYYVRHFEPKDEDEIFYYDMTVTETAKLDQLGKNMREFTDRLCDTYKNGTADQKQKINEVTKNAVKINKERALYDAGRYMEGMRKALPEVFDDAFWAELKESFNNCLAGQYTSKYLLNRNYQVDYSVLLAVKGAYQESTWVSKMLHRLIAYEPDGKYTLYDVENGMFKDGVTPDYTLKAIDHGTWGGTLESVYGALAFDKATGWSRWLLLNEQQPSLWCNNEFEFPAPYKE